MITLHTDAFLISPYVFTCFVALEEKGLPFQVVKVSLGDKAQLRPDYKASSITARVPALTHDDFCVAESSAIVEYLEDVFPAPKHPAVFPVDPRERARARQVISWLRSDDTLGLRDERPTSTMFYARATAPLTARAKASAEKLIEVAGRLLALAPARGSLFDAWCIADADLAFMLHRLILNGHDLPGAVRSFADAQWKRPSVRKFVDVTRAVYVPY
jgi:glutathione S-transferase